MKPAKGERAIMLARDVTTDSIEFVQSNHSIISSVISIAIAGVGAVASFWVAYVKGGDVGTVAAAVAITILALVIYQTYLLRIAWKASKGGMRLSYRIGQLRQKIEQERSLRQHVDGQFEELAVAMQLFYEDLISFMRQAQRKTVSQQDLEDLRSSLDIYLRAICDCASKALRGRNADRGDVYTNIKVIVAPPTGDAGARYVTIARSGSSDDERQDRENSHSQTLEIDSHWVLRRLANNESSVVATLDELLGEIRDSGDDTLTFPSIYATNLYNYMAAIPIKGNSFQQGKFKFGDHTIAPLPQRNNKDMIGFFWVDSKDIAFGSKSDASIMKELAVHAYSAIYCYKFIDDFLRDSMVKRGSGTRQSTRNEQHVVADRKARAGKAKPARSRQT